MQARRIAALAVLAVAAAGVYLPASAAAPKFAGSYKVTLQSDPTLEAALGACEGVNSKAVDRRSIPVPAAGKFKVILDSPDPTGRTITDWDLYLLDKDGNELGSSHGGSSHEEATITLKKKTPVTIVVCNLIGSENGTVTYALK